MIEAHLTRHTVVAWSYIHVQNIIERRFVDSHAEGSRRQVRRPSPLIAPATATNLTMTEIPLRRTRHTDSCARPTISPFSSRLFRFYSTLVGQTVLCFIARYITTTVSYCSWLLHAFCSYMCRQPQIHVRDFFYNENTTNTQATNIKISSE